MIAIWHMMPALRTGNTVVIKPSLYTPLSTIRLVDIMNEVLPAGVVNSVTGRNVVDSVGATIIADLDDGDPLVAEEQFGPALPIIKFNDLDEVIAWANDSANGLGGSVWSKDVDKAKEIASRLECGSVWINKHGMIQPNAPFGGVKKSGIGVEFGEGGLQEYTEVQVIFA